MLTTPAGVTSAHRVVAEVGDVEVAGASRRPGRWVPVNPEAKVLTTPAGVTLLTVLLPSLAT